MEQIAGCLELTQVTVLMQSHIDPRNCSGLLSVTPMTKSRFKSTDLRSHCVAGSFAILLVLSLTPALSAMPRAERHETKHEIDRLEDHWRDVILSRNVPAMDALLADDYMAITSNGTLESKDETLTNLRNGVVQFKSIELSDRKVRFYGSTALVTSRAEVVGASSGSDFSGSFRFTRVYVREANGAWRVVSFEASRIRDPGETK